MSILESRSRLAGKRSVIPATIDGLGAKKFKPELRVAWLAYIRKTYPDGPDAAADIMGDGTLEIDEWVPDAHSLYAHWSPMVDVQIGQFSAMNMHPNAFSVLCNNKYNSK